MKNKKRIKAKKQADRKISKHNDMLHVIECENKDKQIDLMAEQLTISIHDKKWVKEYFENKAKERR